MKKLLSIVLIAIHHLGFSWGKEGHQMVAEIAKVYCSKPVQDSVNKYLEKMTWEDAATWMDEVRSDHTYDYLKPWHYVNVEKDKTYVAAPNIDVVAEIQNAISLLQNKSQLDKEKINFNLKILFHLIGDEHMPLHVGYGDDKGGNTVEVDYNGQLVKLHHLWDTDIIKAHLKEIQNILTEYCKNTTKAELTKLQSTDAVEWMYEGRAYLTDVYNFKKDGITPEYDAKAVKIIGKQIFNAGVRLASILNKTFSHP